MSGTVPPLGLWPLDEQVGSTNPPVLQWTAAPTMYDATAQTVNLNATLVFFAHGVRWTLAPQLIAIPLAGPLHNPTLSYAMNPSGNAAVAPTSASLTLNLSAASENTYELHVAWRFQWGDTKQVNLVVVLDETILPSTPAKATATLNNGAPSKPTSLPLNVEPFPALDDGAIVVKFDADSSAAVSACQLLPGMHLAMGTRPDKSDRPVQGCAALTFTIAEKAVSSPSFSAGAGYFDAIFLCRWGAPLQDSTPWTPLQSFRRIYGSSAGELAISYAMNLTPPDAKRRLTRASGTAGSC